MSNNLTQKYYEGFIKAAVVSGLSFPQAIGLYKKANPEAVANAIHALGNMKIGLKPGVAMAGSALGGAGLTAGAMSMMGGGGHPPGTPPSLDPAAGPAADPSGMPEWAKLLLAGGAGGGIGAGAMAMMPQQQEEKQQQQQSLLPHPPIA